MRRTKIIVGTVSLFVVLALLFYVPLGRPKNVLGCNDEPMPKLHYSVIRGESKKFNKLPYVKRVADNFDIMPYLGPQCLDYNARLFIL